MMMNVFAKPMSLHWHYGEQFHVLLLKAPWTCKPQKMRNTIPGQQVTQKTNSKTFRIRKMSHCIFVKSVIQCPVDMAHWTQQQWKVTPPWCRPVGFQRTKCTASMQRCTAGVQKPKYELKTVSPQTNHFWSRQTMVIQQKVCHICIVLPWHPWISDALQQTFHCTEKKNNWLWLFSFTSLQRINTRVLTF